MGKAARLNRAMKEVEKEKHMDFAKKRHAFGVEIDYLSGFYGRRFVGQLVISKEGIQPRLELERTILPRLKLQRKNQEVFTAADFAQNGIEVSLITYKPSFWWYLPLCAPPFLDFLVAKFVKREIMRRYSEICQRYGLIFYTFVAEQHGGLVAAVDVRNVSESEYQGLFGVPATQVKSEPEDVAQDPGSPEGD